MTYLLISHGAAPLPKQTAANQAKPPAPKSAPKIRRPLVATRGPVALPTRR